MEVTIPNKQKKMYEKPCNSFTHKFKLDDIESTLSIVKW